MDFRVVKVRKSTKVGSMGAAGHVEAATGTTDAKRSGYDSWRGAYGGYRREVVTIRGW